MNPHPTPVFSTDCKGRRVGDIHKKQTNARVIVIIQKCSNGLKAKEKDQVFWTSSFTGPAIDCLNW
jgi:hypothetical protein